MKKLILRFLPIADFLLFLFVYPSAFLLKQLRRVGIHRLPNCKNALMNIGVFPIRDHYYEPQFDYRKTIQPFSKDRILTGIDWNTSEQLKMLASFSFSQELANTLQEKPDTLDFYFNNGSV